jgi:uncharacterized caspase-like protein
MLTVSLFASTQTPKKPSSPVKRKEVSKVELDEATDVFEDPAPASKKVGISILKVCAYC